MSVQLYLPKKYTEAQILATQEAGGKKRNRLAGGWVSDIAERQQVITLCPLCTNKFNPTRSHYRKEKEFPVCQAKCDGCSTWDAHCSWYIYEETYTQVRSTADERRALAKDRERRIKRGYL